MDHFCNIGEVHRDLLRFPRHQADVHCQRVVPLGQVAGKGDVLHELENGCRVRLTAQSEVLEEGAVKENGHNRDCSVGGDGDVPGDGQDDVPRGSGEGGGEGVECDGDVPGTGRWLVREEVGPGLQVALVPLPVGERGLVLDPGAVRGGCVHLHREVEGEGLHALDTRDEPGVVPLVRGEVRGKVGGPGIVGVDDGEVRGVPGPGVGDLEGVVQDVVGGLLLDDPQLPDQEGRTGNGGLLALYGCRSFVTLHHERVREDVTVPGRDVHLQGDRDVRAFTWLEGADHPEVVPGIRSWVGADEAHLAVIGPGDPYVGGIHHPDIRYTDREVGGGPLLDRVRIVGERNREFREGDRGGLGAFHGGPLVAPGGDRERQGGAMGKTGVGPDRDGDRHGAIDRDGQECPEGIGTALVGSRIGGQERDPVGVGNCHGDVRQGFIDDVRDVHHPVEGRSWLHRVPRIAQRDGKGGRGEDQGELVPTGGDAPSRGVRGIGVTDPVAVGVVP